MPSRKLAPVSRQHEWSPIIGVGVGGWGVGVGVVGFGDDVAGDQVGHPGSDEIIPQQNLEARRSIEGLKGHCDTKRTSPQQDPISSDSLLLADLST
jgi:hypothetical protein